MDNRTNEKSFRKKKVGDVMGECIVVETFPTLQRSEIVMEEEGDDNRVFNSVEEGLEFCKNECQDGIVLDFETMKMISTQPKKLDLKIKKS